jgi:dipeptidase D
MKDAIKGLKPQRLWEIFYEIDQIPRCSKHEDAIRQYVINFAERLGLEYKLDKVKNVVIRKPATPGYENVPTVVLQSHLDMVCEKNKDTQHDFSKDPIKLVRKGDWIMADGTTLGADNGIGVAAALAVLEDNTLAHGPLEILFTIDEETGLTGAMELSGDLLEGRILLNLDSEEDGDVYIGCAGGMDTILKLNVDWEDIPSDYQLVRVRVGGLQGGHSGLQINAGLGNAIKLATRLVRDNDKQFNLRLAHIDGGSKHNAIPRECDAILALPKSKLNDFKRVIAQYQEIFLDEFKLTDKNVSVTLVESGFDAPPKMFTEKTHDTVLDLLYASPHGVLGMSQAVPGLVETSTNLAVVKSDETNVVVLNSHRSSVNSILDSVAGAVAALGRLAKAQIDTGDGYPAWQPNPHSAVLELAKKVYREKFNEEVHVKAIHAGLECGLIGSKYSGMDMISFGPTILGAHSPDERVHIPAVEKFWSFLVGILTEIAKQNR